MELFRLNLNGWELVYDREYGIDKRSGWSTIINGVVAAELCSLRQAILQTIHYLRIREQ
jgi:hypothetical protein